MKTLWLSLSVRFLAWLRANPLGPALTVVLTGLAAVFVLPQLTLMLVEVPRFILFEVILGALAVPYAVYRVHGGSPKVLGGIWAAIFLVGLLRAPASLRAMHALSISAHMTVWFLIGFGITAVYGLVHASRNRPQVAPARSIYDRMAEASDNAS